MTLSILLAAITLALVLVLHLRLSRLPHALWSTARKERAQDGVLLLDSMKEAVATRSGHAVVAIQAYQEHIAQSLRVQIAEAETRARAAERRAAEAAKALDAASDLVRDLRAAVEAATGVTRRLHGLDGGVRPPLPSTVPPIGPAEDEAERKTVEMPSAPSWDVPSIDVDFDFDDENEKTRVADRPGSFALARAAIVPPPRAPLQPRYAGAASDPAPRAPAETFQRLRRPSTLLPPRPRSEGCR